MWIQGLAPTLLLYALTIGGAVSPTPGVCSCAQAQRLGGWCDVDHVGFLAGIEIPSEYLYEVLDPHGHDVDPQSFHCESCRAAAASGGFCEEHHIGFYEGKAYFSRLGYSLARGKNLPLEALTCPVCRANAEGHGWCERDGVGMVGNTAIADRAEYDATVEALEVLQRAVALIPRCEHCAAAAVTDTTCPVCRIRYAQGRPVATAPAPQ